MKQYETTSGMIIHKYAMHANDMKISLKLESSPIAISFSTEVPDGVNKSKAE